MRKELTQNIKYESMTNIETQTSSLIGQNTQKQTPFFSLEGLHLMNFLDLIIQTKAFKTIHQERKYSPLIPKEIS